MTTEDRDFILLLWESGMSREAIKNILPYDEQTCEALISELKLNGIPTKRKGLLHKTARKNVGATDYD